MKRKVIGICGFIGSGKTFASKFFEKNGAILIDADEVVNQIYEKDGEGYKKIMNFFGEDFFKKNGEINRRKLAKFVFGDVNKIKILNGLIHPIVVRKIEDDIRNIDEGLVVIESVYFEDNQLGKLVNSIIWIDCKEVLILKRAVAAGSYEKKYIEHILRAQKEIGIKPSRVDFMVSNNSSKKQFFEKLNIIWNELISG